MKFSIHYFFLFYLLSVCDLYAGFAAGTLVKVPPRGYKPIEQLREGDHVFSIKEDGNIAISRITDVVEYRWHKYAHIKVENVEFDAVTGQRFYNPHGNSWEKAKHLKTGTPLLSGYKKVIRVDNAEVIHEYMTVYDIRLDDLHTFFVTEKDIVVHNFCWWTIGFSILWGGGVVTFETFWEFLVIGLVAVGLRTATSDSGVHKQAYVNTPVGSKSYEFDKPRDYYGGRSEQESENSGFDNERDVGGVPVARYDKNGSICSVTTALCIESVAPSSKPGMLILPKAKPLPQPKGCGGGVKNLPTVLITTSVAPAKPGIEILPKATKPGPNYCDMDGIKHKYPVSQHRPGKACGVPGCNPPKVGANGGFIQSDKHRPIQAGDDLSRYRPNDAFPGPASWHEGQKALDKTVPVKNDDGSIRSRVVAWGGRYLVFFPTGNNEWHAHYRPWKGIGDEGLSKEMKEALQKAGMISGEKGKIIKDMKSESK